MGTSSLNASVGSLLCLDACCGSRMFWFDPMDKRTVFSDKRNESYRLTDSGAKVGFRDLRIEPEVISDFTALPFKSDSFPLVVFDPPHLIKAGLSGWLAKKYGRLKEDWKLELARGFSECFRVLRLHGTLVFKWNETDIPVSEILTLTDKKPLFGSRIGKNSKSHWLVFLKESIPDLPFDLFHQPHSGNRSV